MVAIAMTREMGTLGKDVAQGIAESLDLNVVHSELVEHDLATRLGVQYSAVHHYLEGNASLLERWKIDKKKLSQYTAEEILELARDGNVVIRGWGAAAVVRSVPNVLRVRVCAPMAYRERVIMERLSLKNASDARSEIERNDAAHARVMRGFFGVNWENPQLYHVVLNTGCVPVETCVRIVRLLTDDPAFQESETSRAVLADKLIEARARTVVDALGLSTLTGIDISVVGGKVTLSGFLDQNRDVISSAVDKVRQIEGVKDVDNKIERLVLNVSYGA
jgi:cytidylate kinase